MADLLAKEGARRSFLKRYEFFAVFSVFANEAVCSDILETTFKR